MYQPPPYGQPAGYAGANPQFVHVNVAPPLPARPSASHSALYPATDSASRPSIQMQPTNGHSHVQTHYEATALPLRAAVVMDEVGPVFYNQPNGRWVLVLKRRMRHTSGQLSTFDPTGCGITSFPRISMGRFTHRWKGERDTASAEYKAYLDFRKGAGMVARSLHPRAAVDNPAIGEFSIFLDFESRENAYRFWSEFSHLPAATSPQTVNEIHQLLRRHGLRYFASSELMFTHYRYVQNPSSGCGGEFDFHKSYRCGETCGQCCLTACLFALPFVAPVRCIVNTCPCCCGSTREDTDNVEVLLYSHPAEVNAMTAVTQEGPPRQTMALEQYLETGVPDNLHFDANDSLFVMPPSAPINVNTNANAQPADSAGPAAEFDDPSTWSYDRVVQWAETIPPLAPFAEKLRVNEVNGRALLLMEKDELMQILSLPADFPVGRKLQIYGAVKVLQDRHREAAANLKAQGQGAGAPQSASQEVGREFAKGAASEVGKRVASSVLNSIL